MDFENLRREGSRPAIVPNAGLRRTLCWTREDAGRYGEALKKAFPNVLFFKPLGHLANRPEKPTVQFLDRLDGLDVDACAEAIFPYPGWKPDLVYEKWTPTGKPSWDWAHYLSPTIRMGINTYGFIRKTQWGGPAEKPTESYHSSEITTSYRKQIPEEARIQAKAIRLADKMCVRTVAILWMSHSDFLSGRGKIWGKNAEIGIRHVTQTVLDWYRAVPGRAIDLGASQDGWGISRLPVDEIPEDWWVGKRRPKWAQRG